MNITEIEETLLRCARAQQAKGIEIVCGEWLEGPNVRITGCCALAAYGLETGTPLENVRASLDLDSDLEASIVSGFDGRKRQDWMREDYHALGQRLRERLKPREARGE